MESEARKPKSCCTAPTARGRRLCAKVTGHEDSGSMLADADVALQTASPAANKDCCKEKATMYRSETKALEQEVAEGGEDDGEVPSIRRSAGLADNHVVQTRSATAALRCFCRTRQ